MTTLELVHDGEMATTLPEIDPIEVLDASERADWALLLMVSTAGVATLALAAAGSFLA